MRMIILQFSTMPRNFSLLKSSLSVRNCRGRPNSKDASITDSGVFITDAALYFVILSIRWMYSTSYICFKWMATVTLKIIDKGCPTQGLNLIVLHVAHSSSITYASFETPLNLSARDARLTKLCELSWANCLSKFKAFGCGLPTCVIRTTTFSPRYLAYEVSVTCFVSQSFDFSTQHLHCVSCKVDDIIILHHRAFIQEEMYLVVQLWLRKRILGWDSTRQFHFKQLDFKEAWFEWCVFVRQKMCLWI